MKYIEAALISLAATIAPVKAMCAAALFMVLMDCLTGVCAAKKQKQPITSKGFSRTLAKLVVYLTGILVGFVMHKFMIPELAVEHLVSGFIALVEGKSVFENLDIIYGKPIFASVINRLISAEDPPKLVPVPIQTTPTDKGPTSGITP